MDFERSRRVQQLIGTLTEPNSSSLDDAKLSEFKSLLKQSEALVAYAATLLLERLACNNPQARRLCLELCAVLFTRSRAFRQVLTQQFTTLVELTVGHKSDAPLPGPPASATALRARALGVIEEWQHTWGEHYPQVTVAYRYLKKQYKFPEIASRAAAAAAEAAARLQRHQQLLLQRYAAFKQDFPLQRVQLDSLVHQIQECFRLLDEQPQQQQQQQQETGQGGQQADEAPGRAAAGQASSTPSNPSHVGDTGAGDTSDDDDTQWEDVAPAVAAAAAANAAAGGAAEPGGGHAAAAAAAAAAAGGAGWGPGGAAGAVVLGDWAVDELVGDFPGPEESAEAADVSSRTTSLLDQLADLCRQAALAAQHPLLDWLRLLTQVQVDTQQQQQQQQGGRSQQQQQQQERQVLLREVVQLRARLQALLEEAASVWGVSVAQPRRPAHTSAAASTAAPAPTEATSSHAAAAAAAAAAAGSQQGPESADASPSTVNLSSLPTRTAPNTQQQQQQESAGAGQPQHHLTLGSSLRRLQQQQQQQQHAAVRPVVRDAYAGLRDPTVSLGTYTITQEVISRNEQLKFFSSPPDATDGLADPAGSTAACAAAAAAAGGGGGAGGRRGGVSGGAALSPEGPQELSAAAAAAGSGKLTAAEASRVAGRKRPAEGLGSHSSKGSAPEVLKKLAASAPQLPFSGDDWLLAEYGVSRHGMEVYNHWGAVDASVGLPKERLGQFMGYAASYYTPTPSQQQKPKAKESAAAAGAAGAGDGMSRPAAAAAGAGKRTMAAAQLAQQDADRSGPAPDLAQAAASTSGPSSRGTAAASDEGAHVQRRAVDRADTRRAAERVEATNNRTHQQQGQQQGQQQQQQQRQLSRREAASAHNRAVLAGTYTDEGIAAALQQQLDQEAAAAAAGSGGRGKQGRAKKAPQRKADKIRRQLLG